MKKMFLKRMIAFIVLITLLPFDSFVGCFTIQAQAAEVGGQEPGSVDTGEQAGQESKETGEPGVPTGQVSANGIGETVTAVVTGGDFVTSGDVTGGNDVTDGDVASGDGLLAEEQTAVTFMPDGTGFTLEENTIIPGDYYLTEGTLDINGYTLTIQGDLIQADGVTVLNGGRLIIEGDYRMQSRTEEEGSYTYGRSGGFLQMTKEEDYVLVMGNYLSEASSYTRGYLTAGTLEVKKDIVVNDTYAPCGLLATENHKLLLSGDGQQNISIQNSTFSTSQIANLEITNESEAGVVLEQLVYVTGEVNDHGNAVSGTIGIAFSATFTDNCYGGDVHILQGRSLSEDWNIGGDLILFSTVNVTGNVHVGGDLILFSTVNLAGNIHVGGNCVQNLGGIYMHSGCLEIEGDYTLNYENWTGLYMPYSEDYLHVHGNVEYNPYYEGSLTGGTFEVGGNFTSTTGLSAWVSHRFLFSGEGRQEISIASNETFGTVEIQNYSEEGVYSATPFARKELIRNGCRLSYGDREGEIGWTLEEDTVYEGDLILIEDTLDLNGYTLTVTGDLIQPSGIVNINGGQLTIEGDYRMQSRTGEEGSYTYGISDGLLQMTNREDYVLVMGSYLFESSADTFGCLREGTLEVKKDVLVSNTYSVSSLTASENHKLLLSGEGLQNISIEANNADTSYVSNLEITNESEDGVVFQQVLYVFGEVNSHGNAVKGAIGIGAGTSFADNYYGGDIYIGQSTKLSQDLNIGGNLDLSAPVTLSGNLHVEGNCIQSYALSMENGKLEIEGDYTIINIYGSGLRMTHTADYLYVYGDVEFHPYQSTLTAGTFEVGGNFTSEQGLQAGESHRFLFSGEERQEISVASDEHFGVVEIRNHSAEGVYADEVFFKYQLIRNGCRLTYGEVEAKVEYGWTLMEDTVYEGDLILAGDAAARGEKIVLGETLDLNGHTLTVTGDLIQESGTININGGSLLIEGDYRMQSRAGEEGSYTYGSSTAKLLMKKNKDRVTVCGDFVTDTNAYFGGNITAGILELQGDFLQVGGYAYQATGSNTILFTGKETQTWKNNGLPTVVNITNQNKEKLICQATVTVAGTVTDETANIEGDGAIRVKSTQQIADGHYSGAVSITGEDTLKQDLNVGSLTIAKDGVLYAGDHSIKTGNLALDGSLHVQSAEIVCAGDFLINSDGSLFMQEAPGTVLVNGDFQMASQYNHTGYLTDGSLEIKGNFTQKYYVNFVATENHTVILSGKTIDADENPLQRIAFQYRAGVTRFHKLVLKKPMEQYSFTNDLETIADEVIYEIEGVTAPAPVNVLEITDTTETTVTLSYGAAEEAPGVEGYEIYRDGVRIAVTDQTTYTDTGLLPATEYTYTVYPFDEYHHLAETSPEVSAVTRADTQAPTTPQELSVATRTGSSVTLSWEASTDNAGTVSYTVYRDGEAVAAGLTETGYKDSGLEKNTVYRYTVAAYDNAGNVSDNSKVVEAVVAMPEITEISPTNYSSIGGDSAELCVKFKNVGNASGNRVKIEYRQEEGQWELLTPDLLEQKPYNASTLFVNYVWNISKCNGEYAVRFTLYDADGNEDTAEVVYQIDREAPKLPGNFCAVPENGTVKLSWDASVSADCAYYKLYRKEAGTDTYTLLTTLDGRYQTVYTDGQVEEGRSYTYALAAGDGFGNESSYTEPVTVETDRDLEAPEVKTMTPKAGRVCQVTQIGVTAADNKKVTAIRLQYRKEQEEEWKDLGEIMAVDNAASYAWDTTALQDGVYVLRAVAVDANGNESDGTFERRYEVDNTGIAKMQITGHTVTATGAWLHWEDVTESDFAYFQVEQLVGGNFIPLTSVSDRLGCEVSRLTPETSYTFQVVGYDTLGNRGIPSDAVTLTTAADTTGPVVEAVYPVASYYHDRLALSVRAQDNYAIGKAVFSYSFDGEAYETIAEVAPDKRTDTATLSYDFDISAFPEGKLFLRFEVYDTAGNKNALLSNGEDIIVEYMIDHTAPDKVEGVCVSGLNGYVELNWNESREQDIKAYKIYRAEAEDGHFAVLQEACSTKNYYDISVETGCTYIYKVSAIDLAGNEGECSEGFTVTVREDTQKPVITGMTPGNYETVGKNPTIKVLAMDNAKLSGITLEYALSGSGQEIWTPIAQLPAQDRSCLVSAKWNTDGLEEGTYLIRARAIDAAGNVSESYQVTCTLDLTPTAPPRFTANTGHFEVLLNINEPSEEDFAYYEIYRRAVGEENSTLLAKCTEYTYTDSDVVPDTIYRYQIAAYDNCGNVSWSEEKEAYADDIDVVAPIAAAPENLVGLTGMELAFDGMGSTDNVRITSYKWDMGNGDVLTGAQPVYTYEKAGTYRVCLEVCDAAGNTDRTYTSVRIYDKNGRGTSSVKVVDQNGAAIPYAYIYVKMDDGETLSLKADSQGKVTIAAPVGAHNVAAYATGYLPSDIQVLVSEYETKEYLLTLEKDELIVGNLTVRRMTLEEMIEAGVDFSAPENYNRFVFQVTLSFAQSPIPVVLEYVSGSSEWEMIELKGEEAEEGENSYQQKLYLKGISMGPKEEEEAEKQVPILAYVVTTQSVSWLKEMFEVELGILNAADSQYVIEDSTAVLNLPEGVSLAATVLGQSRIQSMGDIRGQEQKSAFWVIKGDESGSYRLSATFEGTLMPFDTKVSAFFETEADFEVSTGEGMHIYVMPESSAYDGEQYYIQFAVANESDRPIYNFTTSIGPYTEAAKEYTVTDITTGETYTQKQENLVIRDPSMVSQSVVVKDGQRLTFAVLEPGDVYYGTYVTTFEGLEEDKKDEESVYYQLVNSLVTVLEGENLGVEVDVIPMESHISRSYWGSVEVPTLYGDPIDLTSGYFADEMTAFSMTGAIPFGLDIRYVSGLTDAKGQLGLGWYHDYEMHLEQRNGIIYFYSSPFSAVSFVNQKALESSLFCTAEGAQTILAEGEEYSFGEYKCLSQTLSGCRLTRHSDGAYTMTMADGTAYAFDAAGRLTCYTDAQGMSLLLTYEAGCTTIREPISGRQMYLHYDAAGRLVSVTDDTGRQTGFTYDERDRMVSLTGPTGETIRYTYDDAGHILTEENAQGVFVANEYDLSGRVTRQTDALGAVQTLTYEVSGDETIVTICDANGHSKQAVTDRYGRLVRVVNENGGTAAYTYDSKGNVLCEKDAYGNCIFKEYDTAGHMVSLTDTGNLTTRFTYDAAGNVTSITNASGQSAYYTYNDRNLPVSSTDYNGAVTTYEYNEAGQLIKQTVEGLGSITYAYEKGMVTSVTDFLGNTTHSAYDGAGNLIRTTDAMGNATTYTYDKAGRLLTATDSLGNTTRYTYDCNGNLTSLTDASGTTTYTYDRAGRQTKITYADGTFVEYAYDAMGNPTEVRFADGTRNTYAYDASGNVVKETLADGTVFTYTYDLLNRRISETDEGGNTVTYAYYPNGNPYKATYPDGTYELYTYNEKWKTASYTDAAGRTTSYEYDAMSNLTGKRDALGNTCRYEYDKWGRLTKETDANGNTTTYAYDSNSNCIRTTNAAGVCVYLEYDALNRMTSAYTRDSAGEEYRVSYAYDALGRVESVTDELGNTTRISYDAQGNVVSVTNADGTVTTVNTYDALGRVTETRNALGLTTTYTYDDLGNLLQAVEQLNGQPSRTTTYTYDALGRLTGVTDPLAGVTSACYDETGKVSSITDANGGTTTYTYDRMGRLSGQVTPLGSRYRYTYNAQGLLEELENARGQKTTYEYDALGRVTSMTDELGTVAYTYDKNGNVLTVTDRQGTIRRTYDALNRVTSYTDCRGNTVKYSYDELGNLISLTYPGGEILRYTYYKNGLLHTVTDETGRVTTYEYDTNGNLTHTQRPNGTEEICTYNEAGLLSEQKDLFGDEVLTHYTYTYDGYGNVTAVEGTETTQTEEGIRNLTSAAMTYDADNRLLTYNGEALEYDADGNMTYGPVNGVMSELVYDCRNRLVQAGGITYTYDAENVRIQAETAEYKEVYVTDTVSASLSRVLTMTVYEKTDGTGMTGTSGMTGLEDTGITTTYIYGQGLIYEETAGLSLYHHYNNLESTVKLTNGEGKVTASYTYGPYGELLSGSPAFTHYLYNGRCGVSTDGNGLYYMRQRYYNPEIKRFVNQDILTGSLDNSQSLNRYSYVQGNPISYTDPFGLSPLNGLFSGTNFTHAVLGLLSCIPGYVGAAASLIDAAVYLFVDKDYGMAALCAMRTLSFGLGQAASLLAKGGTMTKTASVLSTASSLLSRTATFGMNAIAGMDTGFAMYEKYVIQGQSFGWDTLGELGMLGLSVAGCLISAKGIAADTKQLGNMLSDAGFVDGLKREICGIALNNKGFLDLKGGRYTEVEIKSIIDNLKGDGFKNNPLRQAYENEVAGLKAYGEKLLASGMSEEQAARTLNQARRDLGIKYKNATPQPLRDYIYEVNMGRYGDKLGPTYDWLVSEKGATNMEIINSSSRPNSNIDKLLSGFEEWLRRQ